MISRRKSPSELLAVDSASGDFLENNGDDVGVEKSSKKERLKS
jgi:hypothetical protein